MIVAHNEGKILGAATYDVLKDHQGKTWADWFIAGKTIQVTGERKGKQGTKRDRLQTLPFTLFSSRCVLACATRRFYR